MEGYTKLCKCWAGLTLAWLDACWLCHTPVALIRRLEPQLAWTATALPGGEQCAGAEQRTAHCAGKKKNNNIGSMHALRTQEDQTDGTTYR